MDDRSDGAAGRLMTLALATVVVAWSASAFAQESDRWNRLVPEDNGAVLVNPRMGWVLYQYSNVLSNYGSRLEASDALDDWPGISTVYLRLPWAFIEPREGEFNWSIVDTPAQRWIDRGKQIALRLSCSESWLRYATPEWVRKAGAKGYDFEEGKGVTEGGSLWEPDFSDAVFQAKLDRFLATAAARYDGDPHVAFVDVGSFGLWGEGHTLSTRIKYRPSVIKQHIDLHVNHFRRTLLVANDDYAITSREVIDYADNMGLSLRDDSILVGGPPEKKAYRSAGLADRFWPRVPVILEHEHYGGSVQRGCWGDGSWLYQSVEDYHASYMSIHWWPREFLREQSAIIGKINRRLGYRIQLRSIRWPKQAVVNSAFEVYAVWANAGVAPCYPGGYVALTLKDAKGGIVTTSVDETFDVRGLQVGPPGKAPVTERSLRFALPMNMQPGEYDLFVSLGTRIGTPIVAMPMAGDDGNRRYKVGRIVVAGPTSRATAP